MGTLNWNRIIKYTICLWCVTTIAGFIFGFLNGFTTSLARGLSFDRDSVVPLLHGLDVTRMIVMALLLLAVFSKYAAKEGEQRLLRTLFLGGVLWLTSLVNVILGQPIHQWVASVVAVLVIASVAATIGYRFFTRPRPPTIVHSEASQP